MKKIFTMVSFILLLIPSLVGAIAGKVEQPGFLIVAMDRGAMGNREIEALFERFKKEYPSQLAFIGWEENKYTSYFVSALKDFKAKGAKNIVTIPLMVSRNNPYYEKMEKILNTAIKEVYDPDFKPILTPVLSENYLFDQIFYDRIQSISQNHEEERVIAVGLGASTPEHAEKMKQELERLLKHARNFWNFKETIATVFFDHHAEESVQKTENDRAIQVITKTAAKKGKTLVVPLFIGPKTDTSMSFSARLNKFISDMDVVLSKGEVIDHENVLIWLKKMANTYSLLKPNEIGVVLMPHGADKLWNDMLEESVTPLRSKYPIEIAYGMADYYSIEEAVLRIEAKGVKHIIFGRLYDIQEILKEESDYILGLTQEPSHHHEDHKLGFHQVRTPIIFTTFGGYGEDIEVAEVFFKRAEEMSKDPSKETVILLAHGLGDDKLNEKVLSIMARNAEEMKRLASKQFKDIKVAALREDWPDKMKVVLEGIKQIIEEGNKNGRVIIVPYRLIGTGPYERVLKGLKFDMNPNGIAPHPFIANWLEKEIQRAISGIKNLTAMEQERGGLDDKVVQRHEHD